MKKYVADPKDPTDVVLEDVPVYVPKRAKRDHEDRVSERADELAMKRDGRFLVDLPPDEQFRIWSMAEESVTNDDVTAAEYAGEMEEERRLANAEV
jgi:hypothetical protein